MDFVLGSGSEPFEDDFEEDELVDLEIDKFPDGDKYVRILDDVGDEVTVVQSSYSPQDEKLIELLLFGDALKEKGVEKLNAIIPYMAYSRQDRVVEEGEPVSIRAVANMLNNYFDEYYFFDLHNPKTTRFFNDAENLIPIKSLSNYFNDLNDPLIIAPDKGAIKRAEKLANQLNAEYDYLDKHRISPTEVEMSVHEMNVSGNEVIIFDDIISTGGTMSEAVKLLEEQGADSIHATCTHAFLMEDASKKIKDSGAKEIVATNTIPHKETNVSIYPEIKKIFE